MAAVKAGQQAEAGSLRPIPARTQLAAVAWLRWRMFANGLRSRNSGNRSGLVLAIVVRLILWPVFAVWVIGPVVAAGVVAWTSIRHHQPLWLLALLTGIAFLWQFIAVNGTNIAASMPTFDPASVLRYPLPFGRYLVLRILLGLLTPSTIVGCLTLLAAAVGVTAADRRLAVMAFVAFALYAWMNIFFARMVSIWMERLLAVRRARELFGGLMAALVVGIQFLRVDHRRQSGVAARQSWMYDAAMRSGSIAHWLPPGYAAGAVLGRGHPVAQIGELLLLTAWTALFLAAFAYRLHKQYLGEYLSEGVAPPRSASSTARAAPRADAGMVRRGPEAARQRDDIPVLPALLRKEWLTIRSSTGQIMGLLTPLIFVFLMMRGSLATHTTYLLPATVGYAILAPLAAVYNIFGPEGAGVQLYLLAPVRMRDVVLAKNLASLTLVGAEGAIAWAITVWRSPVAIPAATQAAALLWVVFVLALNLTAGNIRSIQAPRKFMPGQARQIRAAPTGRTSGLLVIAAMLASLLLEVAVVRLSGRYGMPWLAALLFGVLALAAVAGYLALLGRMDALVLRHRDVLEKELCGV